MMESDKIKTSVKLETITFSELKYTDLEAKVEFIYSDGSKLYENGKKHVWSLYIAADKYEIPHLRDLCRIQLIQSLNGSTIAFLLLDLVQIPFDKALHDAAFGYIKEHISKASREFYFKNFVAKYPNLVVEIIQAIV